MSDGPRRHHYLFAHRELPSGLFRLGIDLVSAGRDGRLDLDAVWDRVGQTLPDHERLPATGLAVSHHLVADHHVLLVVFPAAQHPAEAHFAAMAVSAHDARVRYIVLEEARSVIDGTRYTVLGEWTEDGGHINYGPGPEPRTEAFLSAVRSHLADRSQPAS
ncbi:hypothetical protein ACQEVZ_01170 [Dactylosporangium sp. CA-152071]|uniref:hypothetical protein n=1 Tax=Dactylosporangium sp. CA-152071 TaxID=3239933 RepID=UPI003D941A16